QALFRALRSRLKGVAGGINGLELWVDSKKQDPVDLRSCAWIASREWVARIEKAALDARIAGHDSVGMVMPRAIRTTPSALREGKRAISVAFLYAPKDSAAAGELVENLKDQWEASLRHSYSAWAPSHVGELSREEVERARQHDLVIALVSPA